MNTALESTPALGHPAAHFVVPDVLANQHVHHFVDAAIKQCRPDRIYWCNGSDYERERLTEHAAQEALLLQRNRSNHHCGTPSPSSRIEHHLFVCAPARAEAVANYNWMEPNVARAKLGAKFNGCMKGRTMYVIPYSVGPIGSPLAQTGVQITDSISVALSIGNMTRTGDVALKQLGESDQFIRGLHSIGDGDPQKRLICHFPQENGIYSFGLTHCESIR